MSRADIIEAWLRQAVGCGYIWGATGWVSSPSRREAQARQYPAYADKILGVCAKWDGKKCYDCAQLVVQAAKQAGYSLPSGATSLWRKATWAATGTMDSIPTGQLVCVFRDDGTGTKQHVGWMLRNGDVIDARGSDVGVVLNRAYKGWTHWAMLPGVYDDVDEEDEGMTARVKGGRLRLRAEPSTEARLLCWMPDGAEVTVLRSDNDWSQVSYGGQVGYCATGYLTSTSAEETGSDDDGPTKAQLLMLLRHAEDNLAELRTLIESM